MKIARFVGPLLVLTAPCACHREGVLDAQEKEHETPIAVVEAGVIQLDAETVERVGIEVRGLETRSEPRVVVAYGELRADPARVWELRAPIAGTLRSDIAWPSVGETLADGARVGSLVPRLSAVERIDLAARLETARGEERAASAELVGAQRELDRVRGLNANGKNASDRAVQESEARVATIVVRVESARTLQQGLSAALEGRGDAFEGLPLVLERGGEVVELFARPGEALEPGAAILRVARFDEVLADIELPLGSAVEPTAVRIVALSHPDRALDGELVARAANVELATRGTRWIARVKPAELALRPGEAVTAYLRVAGSPGEGAIVPREAIVRFAGGAWAFVQVAEGKFARRPLALDEPRESGWFTTQPWTHGASVVVAGAQSLLATEILEASAAIDEE